MTLKLNNITTTQPSTLEEEPLPIQTDTTALDGSVQRNYMGYKFVARLSFTQLSISGYQQIMGIINTGSGISYYNDQTAWSTSPLTFSGLATFTPHPYYRGASLIQDLDVVIRQV